MDRGLLIRFGGYFFMSHDININATLFTPSIFFGALGLSWGC